MFEGFPVSLQHKLLEMVKILSCMFVFCINSSVFLLHRLRMSKNSKVLHLKDKISGNEVDLSLCNLTEVPVRELVSYSMSMCLSLCVKRL